MSGEAITLLRDGAVAFGMPEPPARNLCVRVTNEPQRPSCASHRIYLRIVRVLHALLLTIALLTGQVHACTVGWVQRDGRACSTCPEGPCVSNAITCKNATQIANNPNSDCHDCCSMRECPNDPPSKVLNQASVVNLDVNLPPPALALIAKALRIEPRPTHPCVESSYPNPPPAAASSRAPPFQLT